MKTLFALSSAVAAAVVFAGNAEVDLYETLKDAAPSSPWTTQANTTYTLSQDLELSVGICFANNKYNGTVMDFSQGGGAHPQGRRSRHCLGHAEFNARLQGRRLGSVGQHLLWRWRMGQP